jgi:hypothetical protein
MAAAGTDCLFMLIDVGLWAEMAMMLHFAPHALKKIRLSTPCLKSYGVALRGLQSPTTWLRKRRFQRCHNYMTLSSFHS